MADLSKIKRNVAKMVSQNAPEKDIDSYISSEGVSVKQVKEYKGSEIKDYRPTAQSKFRDFLLGSEATQPVRSVFYEKEKDNRPERARAFVSGAGKTIGIPQLLNKVVGINPRTMPQTDRPGWEIAGRIAGTAPFISGAGALTKGIASPLLKATAQGAIVGGAVSPEDDFFDIGARAIGAGMGALIGGAVQKIGSGFQSLLAKKVKITPKDLANLKAKGVDITNKKSLDLLRVKNVTTKAISTVKSNNEVLQKNLTESIQNNIPAYKTGFKSYFKGFNTTYGESLDDIANNTKIPVTDAKTWLKTTVDRLESNPSYKDTSAFNKIKAFVSKQTKPIKSVILDSRGKPIEISQAGKDVGFKEFNTKIRNVLKGRVYDGASDVNNLVYDELRHGYGDFVANYSDDFAKLQAQARPILELKRFASKIFKPYSQYDTGKLEKLILNNAKGKATLGEQNILKDVNNILNKSGINTTEINKLASDIASGTSKLKDISLRSKIITNNIKSNFIKANSKIRQEIITKTPQVTKPATKMKALKDVLGVAWRVALFNMFRRMGRMGGE